jgi:hypothetical protein
MQLVIVLSTKSRRYLLFPTTAIRKRQTMTGNGCAKTSHRNSQTPTERSVSAEFNRPNPRNPQKYASPHFWASKRILAFEKMSPDEAAGQILFSDDDRH